VAKVDADPALFLNPAAYAGVRDEKKTRAAGRMDRTEFSRLFEEIRKGAGDGIGPLANLPACEEALDFLMDEVRSAGDSLRKRPLPDELLGYKRSVRNFIDYVVKNGFELTRDAGIPRFLKSGFKGQRSTPEATRQTGYTKIQVIDQRLEELASMLLYSQREQIEIAARLEEITGLLVDLLH